MYIKIYHDFKDVIICNILFFQSKALAKWRVQKLQISQLLQTQVGAENSQQKPY